MSDEREEATNGGGGDAAPDEPMAAASDPAGSNGSGNGGGDQDTQDHQDEPEGLEELVAALDAEIAAAPGEAPADPEGTAAAGDPGRSERLVVFSLAGSRYAVRSSNVVEVGAPGAVTPVPNVPEWIVGVANLRGEIVSVVDLGGYLGVEGRTPVAGGGRLMVVRAEREEAEWTSSLLVDQVTGMLNVPADAIGSTAGPIADRVAPYLTGVLRRDDGVVSVLDLDRLLAADEFRQFERT